VLCTWMKEWNVSRSTFHWNQIWWIICGSFSQIDDVTTIITTIKKNKQYV
jgi:hypothetical protein